MLAEIQTAQEINPERSKGPPSDSANPPPLIKGRDATVVERPEDVASLRTGREPTTRLHLPKLDHPVDIYWLTEEQLEMVKQGSGKASDSLALCCGFLGCFVSLFPVWLVATFTDNLYKSSPSLGRGLFDASVVAATAALVKFVDWRRSLKRWNKIVERITSGQHY